MIMINKLYNLKELQTRQQLLQKQQILANIQNIDEEIEETKQSIIQASVQTLGAISDFKILEIHKNTMKEHIFKLEQKKSFLQNEAKKFDKIIIELNKEKEQFKYIKQQIQKEKFKKLIKSEEEASSEYIQAKMVAS